jgi:hypothetical protein
LIDCGVKQIKQIHHKKNSVLFFIAIFIGFAMVISSCEDELAPSGNCRDHQLKTSNLETITSMEYDRLEASVVFNEHFPKFIDGSWNIRVGFIFKEMDGVFPEQYQIQGGLTNGCELYRYNVANQENSLVDLEVRKSPVNNKGNYVLKGVENPEIWVNSTTGIRRHWYMAYILLEFPECGLQEITGDWKASWTEDNVLLLEGDPHLDGRDPGFYNIEHIYGLADPLTFDP